MTAEQVVFFGTVFFFIARYEMILAFPNGFILNIQINAATKKSFQSLINPLAMFLARALNKVVLFFFFFFFFF